MNVILIGFLTLQLGLLLTMVQHRGVTPRPKPVYVGVAPEMANIVDEYRTKAVGHNIKFTKDVTIGFTDINKGRTIGICWYGKNFREIDIDRSFWRDSSLTSRKTLLFHELTHCYCTRAHDWAEGKKYTEVFIQDILDMLHLNFQNSVAIKPGFFDGNCPLSIMHPVVLDDECINEHFDHYMKEMFERCQAW